jgi:hypothetical protein
MTNNNIPDKTLEDEKSEFERAISKTLLATEKKVYEVVSGSARTTINSGNIRIPCYVIRTEDGDIPVLSGRGIQKALGLPNKSGNELQQLFNSKELSGHVTKELKEVINTVYAFKRPGAGGSQLATYGNPAKTLVIIGIFLREAYNSGFLPEKNKHLADKSSEIIDSFAVEGIESAVFRITGYNNIRERLAIERVLGTFIKSDIGEYAKRFDTWFYEEIYRLKGWDYQPIKTGKIKNTNSQLGFITMDIVWDRLVKGLQDKLKEYNHERNTSGKLMHYHHQHLTDKGLEKLESHFEFLKALLSTSKDWDTFMHNLNILKPKLGSIQETLPFEQKLYLN